MRIRILGLTLAACFFILLIAAAQQKISTPPALQTRKIPGINTEDAFPHACVDCHVKRPEIDARFSSLMGQWTKSVDPQLLAKV